MLVETIKKKLLSQLETFLPLYGDYRSCVVALLRFVKALPSGSKRYNKPKLVQLSRDFAKAVNNVETFTAEYKQGLKALIDCFYETLCPGVKVAELQRAAPSMLSCVKISYSCTLCSNVTFFLQYLDERENIIEPFFFNIGGLISLDTATLENIGEQFLFDRNHREMHEKYYVHAMQEWAEVDSYRTVNHLCMLITTLLTNNTLEFDQLHKRLLKVFETYHLPPLTQEGLVTCSAKLITPKPLD